MLILLSLLQPALACDPAPWGVEGSWHRIGILLARLVPVLG